MANDKPKTDWEAIEREYRAGQLSVSEIGRIYGISHTAINKKAKKEGWLRNLADRVREAVSAKLVSAQVSDETKSAKQAVEEAATRVVQIITGHQTRIGRSQKISDKLLDELEADTETSLKDRSVILGNLSAAMKTLIGLERQAFNLSDGDGGGQDKPVQDITDDARAKALANFIARTKAAKPDGA